MDGDFTRAASYVVQEQQDFIKALALSTGPGTLLQMSGDIAIGNVTVTGDTATAVFVGRMCRTESGGSQQPQCVENNDAGTDSPIFTVHLRRVGSSNWQVALPMPTQEN